MKIYANTQPYTNDLAEKQAELNKFCKPYVGKDVWVKFLYTPNNYPNSEDDINKPAQDSTFVYLRLLRYRKRFGDIECNVIPVGNKNIHEYSTYQLHACADNISIMPGAARIAPVIPEETISTQELFGNKASLDDFVGTDLFVKVTRCMFSQSQYNPYIKMPRIAQNTFFIRVLNKDGFEITYKYIYEDDIIDIFEHTDFYTSSSAYYNIEQELADSWSHKAIIDAFEIADPLECYTLRELIDDFNQCELIPDNDDEEDWEDEEE